MAKIGLRWPAFAKGTYSDTAATTYANGAKMGNAVSCNVSFTRTGATLDADDGIVAADNSINGGTITLVLDDMTPANMAAVLGYTADTNGYTIKDSDAADVGFGYVRKRINGSTTDYLVYWYYKVNFSQESDEASTKASSGTNFQTMTLTGTIMKAYEGFVKVTSYQDADTAVAALKTLAGIS